MRLLVFPRFRDGLSTRWISTPSFRPQASPSLALAEAHTQLTPWWGLRARYEDSSSSALELPSLALLSFPANLPDSASSSSSSTGDSPALGNGVGVSREAERVDVTGASTQWSILGQRVRLRGWVQHVRRMARSSGTAGNPMLANNADWMPQRPIREDESAGMDSDSSSCLSSSSSSQDVHAFVVLRMLDTESVQLVWNEDTIGLSIPPLESVIEVEGVVRRRPREGVNPNMNTGLFEISVDSARILNSARPLPFSPLRCNDVGEETRCRYRYLELRSPIMQERIRIRSQAAFVARSYLVKEGFKEIELPTLFRSTPEGAREFLVPTRTPGKFYALAQSPQQYKQMLMASGVDKYFSFARCYRDEGGRVDRQPEFTQIDLETAFPSVHTIRNLIEGLVRSIWISVRGSNSLSTDAFPVFTYREVMDRFGSDKPDIRIPIEIHSISESLAMQSGFEPFSRAFSSQSDPSVGSPVRALCFPSHLVAGNISNRMIEQEVLARAFQFEKDLAAARGERSDSEPKSIRTYMAARVGVDGTLESGFGKKISFECGQSIVSQVGAKANDWVLVGISSQRSHKSVDLLCKGMGLIRSDSATVLSQLYEKSGNTAPWTDLDSFAFLWVVEFPMFEAIDEVGPNSTKLQAVHHPFTAPHPLSSHLLSSNDSFVLQNLKSLHYDLVVNGMEVGGGSLRNHDADIQRDIFERVLGVDPHIFHHLLEALSHGCPPHGGIALGFDRICAILSNVSGIREVMPFPKTSTGRDLLCDAPSSVTDEQLREYHIALHDK